MVEFTFITTSWTLPKLFRIAIYTECNFMEIIIWNIFWTTTCDERFHSCCVLDVFCDFGDCIRIVIVWNSCSSIFFERGKNFKLIYIIRIIKNLRKMGFYVLIWNYIYIYIYKWGYIFSSSGWISKYLLFEGTEILNYF